MLYINIIFYTLYFHKHVTEIANPPEILLGQDYKVLFCASPDFSTTVTDSSQLSVSSPTLNALICSLLSFSLSRSVFLLVSTLMSLKWVTLVPAHLHFNSCITWPAVSAVCTFWPLWFIHVFLKSSLRYDHNATCTLFTHSYLSNLNIYI